jgi:hypothetical protein
MDKKKAIYQIVWGVLLSLMGIAMILHIPHKMAQIVQIEHYAAIEWLIRITLYVVALMLLAGGSRKIYDSTKYLRSKD